MVQHVMRALLLDKRAAFLRPACANHGQARCSTKLNARQPYAAGCSMNKDALSGPSPSTLEQSSKGRAVGNSKSCSLRE
jgi:hypothetical protein